ncbi:MAG: RNA polymerase sigma factor [Planctomycetota bacterium]
MPPPPDGPAKQPDGESQESLNRPEPAEYGASQMQCEATELMTAARQGSVDAFETLFQRIRGSAFQAARSLVGSHEDALDLTQEAFIKAYRARESYDPAQPFLPWFHRILRNTCFSFLRKRGRISKRSIHGVDEYGEESSWDIVDEDAPAPSTRAEETERSAAFEDALAKLSARDREIIVLRHYQELSYKDIAAALTIPEGTVMSRLFHARKRLRTLLQSQVEDLVGHQGDEMQPKRNAGGRRSRDRR